MATKWIFFTTATLTFSYLLAFFKPKLRILFFLAVGLSVFFISAGEFVSFPFIMAGSVLFSEFYYI